MTKHVSSGAAVPVIALYARYSCDKQNATSLEDQLRCCRELAARCGLGNAEVLVYEDAAITGTGAAEDREGYSRMKADWQAGKFNTVLADEWSRMSRNRVEAAQLIDMLENNHRLRLITNDGVDTNHEGWQTQLDVKGMVAQLEISNLRKRVKRTITGQLERGYMLGAPPFGYRCYRDYTSERPDLAAEQEASDPDDTADQKKAPNRPKRGTLWVIEEPEAAIVREVFERRRTGDSMHKIATWLNAAGIRPSGRKAHKENGGHWRPARVKGLLENPIYRGVFVLHNSTTYRARCKEKGLSVEPKQYPRPELQLVSDELWMACNSNTISRSGYGGGTHALTGTLTCGCCGGILALTSAKNRSRSAYCPACTERKSSRQEYHLQTTTILLRAVQEMLMHAVRYFGSPSYLGAYHQVLRQLLQGDRSADIAKCQAELKKLEATRQRLSRMLSGTDDIDEVLETRYHQTNEQITQLKHKMAQLQSGGQQIDATAAQAQLAVGSLEPLAERLFDPEQTPQSLRVVLKELLPSVVFEGKDPNSRYVSYFRVKFSLSNALAKLSRTKEVSSWMLEARFRLQYTPGTAKGERVLGYWSISTLKNLSDVVPPTAAQDTTGSETGTELVDLATAVNETQAVMLA